MVKVTTIEMREKDGRMIGSMPVEFHEGEGKTAYSVHRADLHNALVSRIPSQKLHLGQRLKSVANFGSFAGAAFEGGAAIRARLLIGADGIRSAVRAHFDSTPLTFMKMTTHRTIAPAAVLPADMPNDRLRMWRSAERLVITLPVRGGSEVAIDAVIPTEHPPEKLWSSTSDAELLSLYSDVDPLIVELIRARTADVTTHPVYDKDPIQEWVDGHIALLGDAAHPMTPMQGQGANQAIQDAGVLASVFSSADGRDLGNALLEYQNLRAPIANHFQELSRRPFGQSELPQI